MKLKNILLLLISLSTLTLFANDDKKKKVIVTANIANCQNELGLYRFDGVGFLLLQTVQTKEENESFIFEIESPETTILYIGKENQQKRPIVVGPENSFGLKGDCGQIRQARFLDSKWNQEYDEVINQISNQKRKRKRLATAFQRGAKNEQALENYKLGIREIDVENHIFIDSLLQKNPFLGKLAAIDSYTSYATDSRNHKNELDHYGYEYFADVPLEDPTYDHLTYLFEAFREYSGTLAKTNAPKEIINKYIDKSLARINADRPAYKTALGGIVLGLQGTQHPSYLHYGDLFINKYKSSKAVHIQNLEQQLAGARALVSGGVAPDFTAKTPEGKDMSLSELKGNYVLIDFWASWCGPCRRENPNVVKLYDKYHEKGFDILGVSLDNNKEKWLAAIDKDKLAWHHISDLKGWKSGPAGIYGVRSIPATVLLDKEGKIIARNLRAHQLEVKLAEIFKE